MSSAGSYGSGGSGMAGVITITGDFGPSVTGNVLLTGGTSGGIFTGSGGNTLTMSFNFLDLPATDNPLTEGYISFNGNPTLALYGGNSNIYLGVGAGNPAQSGVQCVAVGQAALATGASNTAETAVGYTALQNASGTTGNTAIGSVALVSNNSSDYNTAVGLQAIALLTSTTGDGNNVAVGYNALGNLLTGTDNIALGTQAGSLYNAAEESNIVIGNDGTTGDNNTIRIGTQGTGAAEQDTTYIAGIYGSTVGGTNAAVFIDNTGKLGTLGGGSSVLTLTGDSGGAVGPSGGGNINVLGSGALSIAGNPGTNTLTASLSGAVVTTYATDTANVTPSANTLNLFGGTGITTASSPNTVTFNLTSPVSIAHGGTNATSMTNTYGVNYYDGTSIVTTTVGSAGQVLTSNGAGVAPTFQAAAGGGVTSITGNTGGALTGALTLTGGTSGAVFAGSGTTLTESFNFLVMADTNNPLTTGYIQIGADVIFQMAGGVGQANPCLGDGAGNAAMSGADNTLIGSQAGHALTSASTNTFVGAGAGQVATTSANNTGIGGSALFSLTTGNGRNSALGLISLENLTTGSDNIGIGVLSGSAYNGAESNNIVIGNAGVNGESNVLRIGTTGSGTRQQNQTFIAGIAGTTVANSAAVLIDTVSEQLGTVPSSRRYKENIHDISEESHRILSLRPVEFTYKKDESHTKQFGLIAEEVEEIFPYLVTYNKDGQPETVRYHELPTLLLKEIQRLNDRIKELEERFDTRIR